MEVKILNSAISMRTGHVISPVDTNFLRNTLLSLKYTIQQPSVGPEIGFEIYATGRFATRDGINVDFNPDKQVIVVSSGQSPLVVINAFNELLKAIERGLGQTKLIVQFYELSATALVQGSQNPLKTFSLASNASKKMEQFSKLLGESVSPFGIRLSPSAKGPDNPDWFECRLEPMVNLPGQVYVMVYIRRNKDLGLVTKALSGFEDLAIKLVAEIEK